MEAEILAYLHCGDVACGEQEDWEIETNNERCERYSGDRPGMTVALYPQDTIARLTAELVAGKGLNSALITRLSIMEANVIAAEAQAAALLSCSVGAVADSTEYARGWNECRQAMYTQKQHRLAATAHHGAIKMSKASDDVLAERQRQISVEGWTPEHDDEHNDGAMVQAAICYAQNSPKGWPWGRAFWKPKSVRRNLVRAAALLIAEIERIDRAAQPQEKPE